MSRERSGGVCVITSFLQCVWLCQRPHFQEVTLLVRVPNVELQGVKVSPLLPSTKRHSAHATNPEKPISAQSLRNLRFQVDPHRSAPCLHASTLGTSFVRAAKSISRTQTPADTMPRQTPTTLQGLGSAVCFREWTSNSCKELSSPTTRA